MECWNCHHQFELSTHQTISRHDKCLKCLVDLRCCKLCEYYDPRSYNECREPVAERIVDKEKANFCDFFKINNDIKGDPNKKRNDQLAIAAALFKK